MNEFIFGLVAGFVKSLVKNEAKRRKMRHIALDIYKAIKTAYADDKDFN